MTVAGANERPDEPRPAGRDDAGVVSLAGPLDDRTGVWRAAEATRRLVDALVRRQVPSRTGREVAEAIHALAERLEGFPSRTPEMRLAPAGTPDGDPGWLDPFGLHDRNPTVGAANPLAPPAALSLEPDRVVGTVRFGAAYEGPPRLVYGGAIAALFDEVMGWVPVLVGRPGMTARLAVRFRAPTPVDVDLRVEGGPGERRARSISTWGRLWAGDLLTAEAEGVFVSAAPPGTGAAAR